MAFPPNRGRECPIHACRERPRGSNETPYPITETAGAPAGCLHRVMPRAFEQPAHSAREAIAVRSAAQPKRGRLARRCLRRASRPDTIARRRGLIVCESGPSVLCGPFATFRLVSCSSADAIVRAKVMVHPILSNRSSIEAGLRLRKIRVLGGRSGRSLIAVSRTSRWTLVGGH